MARYGKTLRDQARSSDGVEEDFMVLGGRGCARSLPGLPALQRGTVLQRALACRNVVAFRLRFSADRQCAQGWSFLTERQQRTARGYRMNPYLLYQQH